MLQLKCQLRSGICLSSHESYAVTLFKSLAENALLVSAPSAMCICELQHEFARTATLMLARHNANYHTFDEPEM